ncbi:MAG: DsbA family protein [Terriglobia bacterium]
MNGKHDKVWLLATILMLVLSGGVPLLLMRAEPTAQESTLSDATRDKILTYIRERFGVPVTVKLSVASIHPSAAAPGFNDLAVTVDDGKKQSVQQVLVSKDSRYLIVVPTNGVLDLSHNSPEEMAQRVRDAFKTPANIKLSVGGFKHSQTPDFQVGTLYIDDGKTKQERPVLLSRDGKHLIVSEIYSLAVDPREQALRTISLRDEPTQGPANAPVTIVEYADLECPTCARVHEFLENTLLPRYGNKVRVVFKEFPLAMHDWSTTAAIACQCAYEMNPSSFVPLRTAIFRSQQLINITNIRETLLTYGEQAGLNRVQLAGCLDAKSSYPRIQRDMAEAKRLNINQTPTLYINGRMMIGLPSEDAYFQLVDTLLSGGK